MAGAEEERETTWRRTWIRKTSSRCEDGGRRDPRIRTRVSDVYGRDSARYTRRHGREQAVRQGPGRQPGGDRPARDAHVSPSWDRHGGRLLRGGSRGAARVRRRRGRLRGAATGKGFVSERRSDPRRPAAHRLAGRAP